MIHATTRVEGEGLLMSTRKLEDETPQERAARRAVFWTGLNYSWSKWMLGLFVAAVVGLPLLAMAAVAWLVF